MKPAKIIGLETIVETKHGLDTMTHYMAIEAAQLRADKQLEAWKRKERQRKAAKPMKESLAAMAIDTETAKKLAEMKRMMEVK